MVHYSLSLRNGRFHLSENGHMLTHRGDRRDRWKERYNHHRKEHRDSSSRSHHHRPRYYSSHTHHRPHRVVSISGGLLFTGLFLGAAILASA